MTKRLEGKTAVITGAASGIGAGTARMFAENGANVVIADMQTDAGKALAAELGDVARFAPCNVTDEDQVAAAVDLAVSDFGRLDIMFNNAGIVGAVGRISETPTDAWTTPSPFSCVGCFLG
jgi:NAD(P)-dependent dehydrogenase (short-subunit alcohol dehydrogenase family)